ncbi:hypothetical protein AGMMS50284_6250 [Clostridia bacterium]|nr:hypothetical protein AGMMS50284_6160 [Clostridia bacterium]GHU83165.1 hypothetical protein AGMMS50284_6250 [Clostridia bacterium]
MNYNIPNYPYAQGAYPPYAPPIMPQQDPKKTERKNLRSLCSKVGIAALLFVLIQNISVIIFKTILSSITGELYIKSTTEYYLLAGLASILALFLAGLILSKTSKNRLDSLISFKKVSIKKSAALLTVVFSFSFTINYLIALLNVNLSMVGFNNEVPNIYKSETVLDYVLMFVVVSLLPALLEEFLFRGVIMGSLRKYGDGFAVLFSSLLFGLVHGNFVQLPFAFMMGLLLGTLTIYTKSIIPAMLLHFFNNANSCLLDLISNKFSDSYANLAFSSLGILFLVLGFIAFAKLARKDKNILIFEKSTSILTLKQKIGTGFSNAGVIIVTILLLALCILTAVGIY